MPKPLITANQVTFLRLALLPIGSWMLYQGEPGQWAALVFMTLVGCTDFVDGWLARKYGPTVLGSLMDPIADKVFVAVTYLPVVDLGWIPWYVVAALFMREFIVTAARTAYERRHVSLKTSYLAKVKTWFQMCGIGLIFMLRTIPGPNLEREWIMNVVFGAIFAGPVLFGLIHYAVKREVWRGSVVWFFCWGAFLAVQLVFGSRGTIHVAAWATLAITYASGGAYLVGMRELPGTGRIDAHDVVRLFGAAALPILSCALIAWHVAGWAIVATVALEFGVGGLDNLLTHKDRIPSWAGWAARTVPQVALLGTALYLVRSGPAVHGQVYALIVAAFAISLVSTAILFWRNRDAYLADLEKG